MDVGYGEVKWSLCPYSQYSHIDYTPPPFLPLAVLASLIAY